MHLQCRIKSYKFPFHGLGTPGQSSQPHVRLLILSIQTSHLPDCAPMLQKDQAVPYSHSGRPVG